MRDLFLLDPAITFLNHGSFGACPREVFEVYQRYELELERQPVEFLGRRSGGLLEAARAALAAMLGARAEDLVFVTNATTGINTVARSLPLCAGDEVLATDQEYGACDLVWEHVCASRGARYVRRPIALPLGPPAEVARDFLAGATERTRVITLSHMTSTTALLLPVAAICAAARSRGILTVVDGAHAPGHVPVDLGTLGADFYAGNCHKWLCAPKGAGFLWARPGCQELLDAAVISWGYSQAVRGHTALQAYTGRTPFVRRHQWQGTRDLAAFLSVPAAIEFQRRRDWERVREACHALAVQALCRISALTGLAPISAPDAFRQMVAVPIPIPIVDLEALKARLYDVYRIEVPLTSHAGQGFIRVSFQGYNDQADLDRLMEALEELLHDARK